VKLACLICILAIPGILPSCKESIDVEEIASLNVTQGTKPLEKEIENFKNWYSNVESSPNAREGTKDEIFEIQEVELWSKAVSHKQSNGVNKLLTIPLLDFKDKKQAKLRKLYLTETNGIKNEFKIDIKSSNGKSDKFTGTVTIMSLDEKSKREYKYKDNKLESKKNLRIADFGNVNLSEVTVSASASHHGTWYFVTLTFNSSNSSQVQMSDAPAHETETTGGFNWEYDPDLVEATIDEIRERILQQFSKHLKPAEMDVMRTMSTSNIVKFYNHYIQTHKITNAMFPNGQVTNDGGHANAFKHVLFAALHAREFGFNLALQLTNAHEHGEVGCNTVMDVANNNIGINMGASNIDINTLANNIYQMAKNGQLWTLGGSGCIHKVPF
jgi:hypothetical protein